MDIFNNQEDDILTKRLKYQILEKKGKLFYNIADHFTSGDFETVFLKGHKKAITALEWSQDNRSVFTASKDCCLLQWDLESQKKVLFKGEKHNRAVEGHFDEPLCLATNGKYLVKISLIRASKLSAKRTLELNMRCAPKIYKAFAQ